MSCRSACCLIALFVLCFAPTLARADDTQDIRAVYAQIDAAYSQRDVPAIMGFLTPGFRRLTWNAVLTPAEFQSELKDSLDDTASVGSATKIEKLDVHGDNAQATVARRLDLSFPKPLPELPPPYIVIKVTQERWQKSEGHWRMTEMSDTPLYQTLCLLNERDQSLRILPAAEWRKPVVIAQVHQIDAADRARLKQIIRQYGWPGFDLVGTDGANIAWGIVQHADDDKAFQRQCLPLIEAAVKRGQEMPSNAAYLTDRILCGEHKPQIYGTQGTAPIADPAHVDEHRAAVGLGPLAEYRMRLKQIYGPPKKP